MKEPMDLSDSTVERQRAVAAEGHRRCAAIAAAPAAVAGETVDQMIQRMHATAAETAARVEREARDAAARIQNGSGVTQVETPAFVPESPMSGGLRSAPNGRGGCMSFEEIMRYGGR
jgi:hypothetical protein